MELDGQELTDRDLGRPVRYTATHDPGRAPARGLLAGWGSRLVLVRFYSERLGTYRAVPFAVRPEGIRWAEGGEG